MQFERFDIVNGKFESRGILTRSCANSKKHFSSVVDGKQVADNEEEEKQVDHGIRHGSYQFYVSVGDAAFMILRDSFNLTLTEAEREARERVILPHMERQTESKIEIESET